MSQTFRKDPLSYQPNDEVEGRYRITGTLGKGGFGAVYAAEHTGTHQQVALKVLTIDPSTSEDDVIERFLREARITAQLRSHNTVRVFDVGEISNGPMFMAMEMLKGPELEKVLRSFKKAGQTMPEPEAVELAVQVLKSLSEAHRCGLVHRDLKPANIMLADMGEDEPVVKVLDFGIARTEGSSLTGDGKALGTPAYMSPEQCMARDLDGRSDLYSLAVILFRCLTGRLPFESRNSLALLNLHLHEPAPDPRTINLAVSEEMSSCILRALSKDPDERYQSAKEMRQALQGALGGAWAETPAAPMDALLESDDLDGAPTVSLSTPRPMTAPSLSAVLKVDGEDLMEQATVALDVATSGVRPAQQPSSTAGAGDAPAQVADEPASSRGGRSKGGILTAVVAVAALSAAAWFAFDGSAGSSGGAHDPTAAAAEQKGPTVRERAEARAEAQLARTTNDIGRKVTYLQNAVKLDPTNLEYPVLLGRFEKALAANKASAAAKAADDAAAQKAAAIKAAASKAAAEKVAAQQKAAARKQAAEAAASKKAVMAAAAAKARKAARAAPRKATSAKAAPVKAAAPKKPKTTQGDDRGLRIEALD